MAVTINKYTYDGSTTAYTTSSKIISRSNAKVYYTFDEVDNVLTEAQYSVLENIVILETDIIPSGSELTILVSSDGAGLDIPPSKIDIIYDNIDKISNIGDSETVANINSIETYKDDIHTVAGIETKINTVANNISDVVTVGNELLATDNIETIGIDLLKEGGSEIRKANLLKTNIDKVVTLETKMTDAIALETKMDYTKNTLETKMDNTIALTDKMDEVTEEPFKQSILDASANATTATEQATTATTKAGEASDSATNSQLRMWEAEAFKKTADSYATEPENVYVKIYTSNGDGTFTASNTTEYSALHWQTKASNISGGGLLIANNLSDLDDVVASRTNLGLDKVDNTSDLDKPISTAVQNALDNKMGIDGVLDDAGLISDTPFGNEAEILDLAISIGDIDCGSVA